jgi:hypothetical protein
VAITAAAHTIMAATRGTTGIAATMNDASWQTATVRMSPAGVFYRLAFLGVFLVVGFAQSTDLDGFAKCLGEKKTTMYGSFLCSHCDDQKKMFGSSFRYVPYVECTVRGSREMTFPCIAAQIRYTPTWIFADGERRTGIQQLKDLSEKTGCKLP